MKTRRKFISALVVTCSFVVFIPAIPAAGAAPKGGATLMAGAQATDWKQIRRPPLPAFHPQEPHRVALPNGMVIFFQEDHELPLIRGTARVRGGSREEPGEISPFSLSHPFSFRIFPSSLPCGGPWPSCCPGFGR